MVEQETQHKQIYANILQLDDHEEEIERVEPLVDKQQSNPSFEGHERIEVESGRKNPLRPQQGRRVYAGVRRGAGDPGG